MERKVRKIDDYEDIIDDLKCCSFSLVEIPGIGKILEQARKLSNDEPFATEGDSLPAYNEFLEFGFCKKPHKTFFACKLGHKSVIPFWGSSSTFAKELEDMYKQMFGMACDVLKSLDRGFDKNLMDYVEELDYDPGEISTSFMHLFKYAGTDKEGVFSCMPHTDSGLITLIPMASSSGLEVLNFQTGEWMKTEKMTDNKDVATIIVGETMTALTECQVLGSVHRVYAPEQRVSVPFQLKALEAKLKML